MFHSDLQIDWVKSISPVKCQQSAQVVMHKNRQRNICLRL